MDIKTAKAIELFDKLNTTLNKTVKLNGKEFDKQIIKPNFL